MTGDDLRPRHPRLLVVAGIAAMAWYLGWLLTPGRASALWLFVPLLIADLFNGCQALSFWLTCLRGPRRRPFEMPSHARVEVLIPSYNEPAEIVRETVRAARDMHGATVRVWLLDDGDRREMLELARRERVQYLARAKNRGAKAGNLNDALTRIGRLADAGEFIAVFDADHMPFPEFLERTLGLFVDYRVVIAQTPQTYRNWRFGPLTRAAAEQQEIFFGPIMGGKDGFDSAFCCGTNFVASREALTRAGGFPEDSVTEDIVLSTKLVAQGGTIAYVPQRLSMGLGPEDADAYLGQQQRWAIGCLKLLLTRGWLRDLSPVQRWQYLTSTSYWLTGWTLLAYLLIPVAKMLTGASVVHGSSDAFIVHFIPYFVLCVVSLGRFTTGAFTVRGIALNWGCFAVHVLATLAALTRRPQAFRVTSKTGRSGMPWRGLASNLIVAGLLIGTSAEVLVTEPSVANIGVAAFAAVALALCGSIVVLAAIQSRQIAALAAARRQDRVPAALPLHAHAMRPGARRPLAPVIVPPPAVGRVHALSRGRTAPAPQLQRDGVLAERVAA